MVSRVLVGLGLHEGLEILSHRFVRLGSHRQGHPTIGTHRIDCHWERRDASTHGGIFKQQGFASTRFFISRSAHSVISSSVATGSETRINSPIASNFSMKSLYESNAILMES